MVRTLASAHALGPESSTGESLCASEVTGSGAAPSGAPGVELLLHPVARGQADRATARAKGKGSERIMRPVEHPACPRRPPVSPADLRTKRLAGCAASCRP